MGTVLTAVIGMGLTAAGGMEQAQGVRASDQAQADTLSYQSMIARNNAVIAQKNAQWTSETGEALATAEGMKTAANVSSMKASQAASGIDVNTGSALAVRDAAQRIGEINALTIKSNKAREAWGYQVDKSNEERQAALDTRASSNAQKAGKIGYESTLLSTAGSVFGQFSKMQTDIAGSAPTIGSGGLY